MCEETHPFQPIVVEEVNTNDRVISVIRNRRALTFYAGNVRESVATGHLSGRINVRDIQYSIVIVKLNSSIA